MQHHNLPQGDRRGRTRIVRPTSELLERRVLLSAGDVDASFGTSGLAAGSPQGPVYSSVQAMAVQPDGKTVVVGQSGFDEEHLFIARFDLDGSLDPTFGIDGVHFMPGGEPRRSPIRGIALESDGRIIVTASVFFGAQNDPNGYGALIMRFNPDGSFDTTFNGTGQELLTAMEASNGVVVQSDGRITISGESIISGSPWTTEGMLLRLNPNGSLDNTFGSAGMAVTPSSSPIQNFSGLTIDGGGRIDAVGTWSAASGVYDFGVERYNADGSIDTSFGTNGLSDTVPGSAASNPVLDSNGNILVGGWTVVSSSTYGVVVARLTGSGSLDTSFGTGGSTSLGPPQSSPSYSVDIGLRSSGQILAGSVGQLALLTSSGQLDSTYNGTGFCQTASRIKASAAVGKWCSQAPPFSPTPTLGKPIPMSWSSRMAAS